MKIIKILLLVSIAILSVQCKETSTKTEETETMVDTTSMPSDDPMVDESTTSENASPIMASMQKMMDDMHKMEKTGIADVDLAMSMKHHHQGAIDMANAELSAGTDAKLKDMAKMMIDKQQKEIAELETIISQSKTIAKNYDPESQDAGLGKAMMDNMMSMMKMPEAGTSVDKDFATMMIKHHKDGIMMGQAIKQYAKHAKFKSMTDKMMADQKKEISELENWVSTH